MKRVLFLVSGNGGTLKYILNAQKKYSKHFEVVKVIANKKCGAWQLAQEKQIPVTIVDYKKGDGVLLQEMKKCDPDIIITTFHKVLDNVIVDEFEGKMVNLHYSLLPSFGQVIGMKTVDLALSKNVGFVGSTCHNVSKEVDQGRIYQQAVFSVNWALDNRAEIEDLLFYTGCINLLSFILCTSDASQDLKISKLEISNRLVLFSPSIVKIDYSLYR